MAKLRKADLMSLETYSEQREAFRQRVIKHKKHRRLALGENAALYFEDALTMQYQVQEMLRIEKIFEAAGIQEELDVYNPLIPDGSNFKATFMLEYGDEQQRRAALAQLVGIEEGIWLQPEGCERVLPIANEDLDRSAEDKTASVHFLRFELTTGMVAALKSGAPLLAGIDHANYQVETLVPETVRQSLLKDLD